MTRYCTLVCKQKLVLFIFPVKTSAVIVFTLKRKITGRKAQNIFITGVENLDNLNNNIGFETIGGKSLEA